MKLRWEEVWSAVGVFSFYSLILYGVYMTWIHFGWELGIPLVLFVGFVLAIIHTSEEATK